MAMSDKWSRLVLILCVMGLYYVSPCSSEGTGGCTSGFMSLDRMEAVLGRYRTSDVTASFPLSFSSSQVLVPYSNFTCDGNILSWRFAAEWEGNSPLYTELQIWRSTGSGSFTKVGSTTIMVEEEDPTRLYQYPLSSPLAFQAGDILGYFQGASSMSQLRLLSEDVGSGHLQYYSSQNNPASQFTINEMIDHYHPLIHVETDSPGCVCGFMSVERMRILLGLDTVGSLHNNQQRQQITPDIKFTCDGLITKWIVVATWRYSNNFYPELQVWRKVESNAYHKINGTFIIIEKENINRIYEYEDFSPIPVQTGDILGIFIPRSDLSRLRVVSERDYGPTNYYIRTSENAAESPYDTIDIDNTPSLLSFGYNVLVTVEISAMDQPSSSTPLSKPSSSDSLKSPSPTPSHSSTLTQPLTGSSVSLISLAFSTPPSSTSEEGNSRISFQPTQIVPTPSVQSSFAPEEGNSQTSFQPTHTQSVLTSSIQPSTVPEKGSGQPLFTTTQTILVSALVAGVLLIVTCHWIAIISCCLVCRKKKKKVSNNDVSLQSFNKSTHTDISRSTEQQQKDAANPSQQNYMYQHQYMPQPINQSDGFSTSFNHAMQRENSPEYAYIGMPYQHTLMPAHPHPAYQPVQDDQEHIYY